MPADAPRSVMRGRADAARQVHRRTREQRLHRDIERHFAGELQGLKIAVWGLSFKPKTDDMREAKSLDVIADLLASGATVKAYDPIAMENTKPVFPHITYGANAYEVATGADALVIVTEWNEFKNLNFERLSALMARPLILDGRNLYDPERLRRMGFEYHSIGRAPMHPVIKVPTDLPISKSALKETVAAS